MILKGMAIMAIIFGLVTLAPLLALITDFGILYPILSIAMGSLLYLFGKYASDHPYPH